MTLNFGTLPTPLEPAPRLSVAIGLEPDDLWIKRDDLTGLGGGGNKVRKLEQLVAAAIEDGTEVLVTSGAAQSNHARLTAAAGARAGLDVVLVLAGEPSGTGNLVLDALLGAELVWVDDFDEEVLAARVDAVAAELRGAGRNVMVIPYGGSNAIGARGYQLAGDELLAQDLSVEVAVVAVGSGGTMAGLCASLGVGRVLGVDCGAVADPKGAVARLLAELSQHPVADNELWMRLDQVGESYGRLTDATLDAMRLAARTEGIVLDPVYTGRALAGLIASVKDGSVRPGQRVIFMHTGGLPGLFGHAEAMARVSTG